MIRRAAVSKQWISSARSALQTLTLSVALAFVNVEAATFAQSSANKDLLWLLQTKPAQVLLDTGKAAGSAATPASPAFSLLKGASDTADIFNSYNSGGAEGAWDKVAEKSLVKGAQTVGGSFGPVGSVTSAATMQASLDIGKYFIAPKVSPWLADRWIEQDKRLGLTEFGLSMKKAEQEAQQADDSRRQLLQQRAQSSSQSARSNAYKEAGAEAKTGTALESRQQPRGKSQPTATPATSISKAAAVQQTRPSLQSTAVGSQQKAAGPSGASGSVPAASTPSVQSPNTPSSGAVQSTNPNLQMYSFKPLANGNVEIYENGKPTSTGSGFARSYAQSLGYSLPLPQQTAVSPSVASPPIPSAASSSNYTFTPTQYGTIQVSRNGQIIATTTPQLAAQAYGYPLITPPPTPTPAPITSAYATTPSGAVVNVATGQLVSPPPNVSSPKTGPVQSTNLPSQPVAVPPSISAKAPSSVGPAVQAPQPNTQVAARAPAPNTGVSSPSVSPVPRPTASGINPVPGGISLSRAAADRMPLEIALDASAFSDGKIVLSGRASKVGIDAALFLTALRAACDDRDPYFSLDPDNGALWSQQGDQASNEFWEKIKKDFPAEAPARAKNALPGVNIRTVSATQDYAGIWHDISPHYRNFRAKLVFYPEWLRQTRLGEVLYKADVLLKELSSGVSILVPGKLRASAIPAYLSADVEYAAKGLLAGTRDQLAVRPQWRGSRLWFEITPSESPTIIINEPTVSSSAGDPALRSLLQSKGLIRSTDQSVHNASFFTRHGSVYDLSQVNPIMFVRVHDHTTNKDLSDHDPRLDGLAADVSTRFDQYAQHYAELGSLREVVRAYIAARKITDANERLCGSLEAMPLLDSEKLATKLPDYHPSELFVTIASYSTVSRKGGQTQFVRASSMSGGVSIAGQKFVETAMRDGETTVTRAVETTLAGVAHNQLDAIDSDRKVISFVIDDGPGAAVRLASNAPDPLAPRSLSEYPIENEPGAAISPFARQGGKGAEWGNSIGVFLALMAVALLVNYVARKRRIIGS